MDSPIYSAKRFWFLRPTIDDEFVEDHASGLDSRRLHAPHPVQDKKTFDAISHVPCLVLLGELGIGKTEELKRQESYIKTSLVEAAQRFDLSGFQSEAELRSALVQDPSFITWLAGTHRLHLFLDSFDEALLTLPVLPKLLPRILTAYREHLDRLSLRIACRTADWRKSLEDDLKKLWTPQQIEVYQLAPLDIEDVREIARANVSSPDHFLAEIDRKGVMPLAMRPITLTFLLDLYRIQEHFPDTKQQLYLEGCKRLCTEPEERRDAGMSGKFSPEHRLLIAGRLAFLSLVTHRPIFWMDIDQGDVPQSDLTLYECYGEPEELGIPLTEQALRETLATGLFSSRGQKRLGWGHRSYAEFLAAYYLVHHQCPVAQVMNLLVHPDDKQHKLDPRLHEIAAWCAILRKDLFQAILFQEPEVLFRSDLTVLSNQEKEDLLTALLRIPNPGVLWYIHQDTLVNRPEAYKNLIYPGLTEQLQPSIADRQAGTVRRLVTMSIAKLCELPLQEEFLLIALDRKEKLDIRNEATQTLIQVGNKETKAKLKPLLLKGLEEDPDDELKASFLRACWPGVLTAPELFALLTPTKNEDVVGAYYRFFVSYLPECIAPEELPTALRWIIQLPHFQPITSFDGRTRAANALLLRAVKHLDRLEVQNAFVDVLVARLSTGTQLIDSSILPEPSSFPFPDELIRYRLLEILIRRLSVIGRPATLLAARPPLVFSRDIPWLLALLSQVPREETQQFIAQIVGELTNRDDPELFEAIRGVSEQIPSLAQVHTLHSERSTPNFSLQLSQKERYQSQENEIPVSSQVEVKYLLERIAPLMDAFDQGDSSLWPHIIHPLREVPDGTWFVHALDLDVTSWPGWPSVESTLGKKIKDAARKYIEREESNESIWQNLDSKRYHTSVISYAQAFYLVFQPPLDVPLSFSPRVWGKLSLALFIYAALDIERSLRAKSQETNQQLICKCYQHAPTEVIQSLLLALEREAWECDYTYPRILQLIAVCRDEPLNLALVTNLQGQSVTPKCMRNILSDLLLNGVDRARSFAEMRLSEPFPLEKQAQECVVHVAFALLTCTKDAGWSVIWPKFLHERSFALQFGGMMSHGDKRAVERLTEKQIAQVYAWLVCEYPSSKYPTQFEGFVGAVDHIAWLRDNLLSHLSDRGTFQACEALEQILQEVPEADSLSVGWMLADTHLVARQQRRKAVHPQELLKVIQNQRRRLVENEDQLLLAIIESLEQLNFKLHENNNPALRDVWDYFSMQAVSDDGSRNKKKRQKERHVYRPIDENEFSDYVKRHLEADLKGRGIVANREVVISPENRIDIRVDALTFSRKGQEHDIVSVIIEVKGCWNTGLQTSMKEQLAERYLKNNRCQHGLYLVGWFRAQAWGGSGEVKGDSKKCILPSMTIEDARHFFDNQAKSLSQSSAHIRAFVLDATLPEGYGASS